VMAEWQRALRLLRWRRRWRWRTAWAGWVRGAEHARTRR
jgi:hypothetical protein